MDYAPLGLASIVGFHSSSSLNALFPIMKRTSYHMDRALSCKVRIPLLVDSVFPSLYFLSIVSDNRAHELIAILHAIVLQNDLHPPRVEFYRGFHQLWTCLSSLGTT